MAISFLKKVSKLKNVRNYLEFTSNSELTKKNVIYAVNGNGKTNLSRFFVALSDKTGKELQELKSKEALKEDIEFTIHLENGDQVNQENYLSQDYSNLHVYNSDNLEKVIRINHFSDKTISGTLEIELGEEQKKLSELTDKQKAKKAELDKRNETLKQGLESKIEEIRSWDGRNSATIEQLTLTNLTKENYHLFQTQKEDYYENGELCEGWVKSKENFDAIKDLTPENDKINFITKPIVDTLDYGWIKDVFTKEVNFIDPPNEEIKEHILKISNEWIKQGLIYHKSDEDNCPFCMQMLDESSKEIIKKYQEHTESEKAKYQEKCDGEVKIIESLIRELSLIDNSHKNIFETRASNLKLNIKWEDLDTVFLIEELNKLKTNIEDKKIHPQKIITDQEEVKERLLILNQSIENNSSGVILINKELGKTSTRQTHLRKLLGKKYLVEIFEVYKTILEERAEIDLQIKEYDRQIEVARKTLPKTEASEKIVELFNIFIKQIGMTKYSAEIVLGKIILKLENRHDISGDANKIVSEGEKNAIAFSYFLASSILKSNSSEKMCKSIFIIDDPICSMSYKYFYGVCDVVKTFSHTIQKIVWGKENLESPQTILLTHNVQFFNMLSTNVLKSKASYFELEKNGSVHSLRELEPLEKLSDFETALRRVRDYGEGRIQENVSNDLRRVMETICHFHGYKLDGENFKKIFEGAEGDIILFAQDGSHADINNFEDSFDMAQYREMSQSLLTLMQPRYSEIISNLPA